MLSGDFTGPIGLGLSWLVGKPTNPFHLPSYFFTQIVALQVEASGGISYDFHTYFGLVYSIHFVCIAIAGLWVSALAKDSKFSPEKILFCSIVTATMPTTMGFLFSWVGPYFLFCLFSFPLFLTYYSIYHASGNDVSRLIFFAMTMLGFMFGNLISMASVVAGVGLLFLVMLIWNNKTILSQPRAPLRFVFIPILCLQIGIILYSNDYIPRQFATMLVIPVALVLTMFLLLFVETFASAKKSSVAWSILEFCSLSLLAWIVTNIIFGLSVIISSTIMAITIALANIKIKTVIFFLHGILFPFSVGIFCAYNVLSKYIVRTFKYSLASKGGAAGTIYSLPEYFFHPIELLKINPWSILLMICLTIPVILFVKDMFKKKTLDVFSTISYLILLACLAAILNIQFTYWTQPTAISILPRYFTPAIGAICFLLLYIVDATRGKFKKIAGCLILTLCVYAAYTYYSILIGVSAQIDSSYRTAKNELQHTDYTAFLCMRDAIPHACLRLYSYNNYLDSIKTEVIEDGIKYKYILNAEKLTSLEQGEYLIAGNIPKEQCNNCNEIFSTSLGYNIYTLDK